MAPGPSPWSDIRHLDSWVPAAARIRKQSWTSLPTWGLWARGERAIHPISMELFFPRNSPSQVAPDSKQHRFHPNPPPCPLTGHSLSPFPALLFSSSCLSLSHLRYTPLSIYSLTTSPPEWIHVRDTGGNPGRAVSLVPCANTFQSNIVQVPFFHFLDLRDLCAATGSVISMKTWLNLVNNNKYNQSKWPWNLRINSGINTAQNAELACVESLIKHWQSKPQDMLYFTEKGSPWHFSGRSVIG